MSRIDPNPPGASPPVSAHDPTLPFSAWEPAQTPRSTSSDDPYRLLFESNPNPMWVYDLETLAFLAVNEAAIEAYGYSREEFLSMTIADIRPPEEVPLLLDRLASGDVSSPRIWRHRHRDGTLADVEIRSRGIELDGRPCRLVLATDVTERLAAYRSLRDSEARFRELFENASVADEALRRSEERYRIISDLVSDYAYALRVERDGALVLEWITGAFTRDLGYTAAELNEQGLFTIVHPEDLPEIAAQLQTLGANERSVRELRLIARSGEVIWGRFYSTAHYGEDGRVEYIYGAGQNITERKMTEEALRDREQALSESERRFRALIENSSEAVMLWKADATIAYVTPSTSRLLGYPEEELVGKNAFESLHRDDAAAMRQAFEFCLQNPGKNVRGAFRVKRKDGTWRWIEGVGKNLIDDPAVGAVVTTFRDVTERVNAERELKSSLELLQKVDAERRDLLARLVNAQEEERERIALEIHDESIQVMTAISMRLEVLERRITDPELADSARQLQDAVRRCVASLRELIFEVHPHALEQYGLGAALRQLLEKASRETGIAYELDQGLTVEPPSDVRLTVYRICQEAVTNVIKHAGAGRVEMRLSKEAGGVRGSIGDDGIGFSIDPESESTSRLGLAAMRARAETAGGWWRVDSSPGAGTRIDFWVPVEEVAPAG